MTTRTVAVWEATEDLIPLSDNKFNFQFAKSVIGKDGQLTTNVVWQSKALAPRMSISWTPVYGLNWALEVPAKGLTVQVGGAWQACAQSQAFEITKYGTFAPGTGGKADYLNISSNNYGPGLHVVVGLQDANGGFDIIYVDPIPLGLNMSSWYQPQEKCQWWYESGMRTSSMITGAGTPRQNYDFSGPDPRTGLYYVSTTYKYNTGVWVNGPYAPPSAFETGLLRREDSTAYQAKDTPGATGIGQRVSSIETLLTSILEKLQFGGGAYLGHIIWKDDTKTETKEETIEAIIKYLEKDDVYFASKASIDTINFGPYGSPPQDPWVPPTIELLWERAVDDRPGVLRHGDVTYVGPKASNGDHNAQRKVIAKKLLEETLNGAISV